MYTAFNPVALIATAVATALRPAVDGDHCAVLNPPHGLNSRLNNLNAFAFLRRSDASKLNQQLNFQAKTSLYWPEHPGRSTACFNQEVAVQSGELVTCRHLTQAYANADKKAQVLRKALATKKKIQRFFEPYQPCFLGAVKKMAQLEQQQEHAVTNRSNGAMQLLSSARLGDYLEAMATALAASPRVGLRRRQRANIFLFTQTHAMALYLQRKRKPGKYGAEHYFALTFYDPNLTANHLRLLRRNSADLQTIDFNALCPDASDYAECAADLPLVAFCEQLQLADPASHFLSPGVARCDGATLRLALHWDVAGALPQLREQLRQPGPALTQEALFALLSTDHPQACSGLRQALCSPDSTARETYGLILLDHAERLSPLQLQRLLEARQADQALLQTLAYDEFPSDSQPAMRRYAKFLQRFTVLPKAQLLDLLAARDASGTSLLCRIGLEAVPGQDTNRAAAIDTLQLVLQALAERLEASELMVLFGAKDQSGASGFANVMAQGSAAAIRAYGRLIAAFSEGNNTAAGMGKLNAAQVIELLLAINPKTKVPALAHAIGRTDHHALAAVNAFGDVLRLQKNLRSPQLLQLLLGDPWSAHCALASALQNDDFLLVATLGAQLNKQDGIDLQAAVDLLESQLHSLMDPATQAGLTGIIYECKDRIATKAQP